MPIAATPSRTGSEGCLVRGTIVASAGHIELRCEDGGVFGGTIYGTAPLSLTPDGSPVRGGQFEVRLPPSSAVGRYILRVGRKIFRFRVPDAPEANLNDLLLEVP